MQLSLPLPGETRRMLVEGLHGHAVHVVVSLESGNPSCLPVLGVSSCACEHHAMSGVAHPGYADEWPLYVHHLHAHHAIDPSWVRKVTSFSPWLAMVNPLAALYNNPCWLPLEGLVGNWGASCSEMTFSEAPESMVKTMGSASRKWYISWASDFPLGPQPF